MADLKKTPGDREKVYSRFLNLAKWATILVILLLTAMAVFLYNRPAPPVG